MSKLQFIIFVLTPGGEIFIQNLMNSSCSMFEAEAGDLPSELIQIRTDKEFPRWLKEYVSSNNIRLSIQHKTIFVSYMNLCNFE